MNRTQHVLMSGPIIIGEINNVLHAMLVNNTKSWENREKMVSLGSGSRCTEGIVVC